MSYTHMYIRVQHITCKVTPIPPSPSLIYFIPHTHISLHHPYTCISSSLPSPILPLSPPLSSLSPLPSPLPSLPFPLFPSLYPSPLPSLSPPSLLFPLLFPLPFPLSPSLSSLPSIPPLSPPSPLPLSSSLSPFPLPLPSPPPSFSYRAASLGLFEVIQVLSAYGANFTMTTSSGENAMHFATAANNLLIVRLLGQRGVS